MGENDKQEPKTISTLNDLFEIVDEEYQTYNVTRLWWRGLSRAHHDLIPKVFRPVNNTNPDLMYRETQIITRFQNRTPARLEKYPDKSDEWLFLAQHYGLPTRLLDWTESAMIGLYFAIRDNKHWDNDGSLWMLNPSKLNKARVDVERILGRLGPHSGPLFGLKEPEEEGHILAISTPHGNLRMLFQQSVFTIHGTTKGLDQFEGSDEYLSKYIVPHSAKANLVLSLKRMGIVESYIFPEIEYLAQELKDDPANYRNITEND